MPWYIFAFLAAIFTATAALLEKRSLLYEHAASFSAALSLVAFIITLVFLPVADFSNVTPLALMFMAGGTIIGAGSFLLVTKSVRHLEVSTVSPMLVTEPAIVAILAFFLLREQLQVTQVFGICLLVVGTYLLETAATKEFNGTISSFFTSRYVRYVFLAMLFYSISSLLDRVVLSRLNLQPEAYMLIVHLFLVICFVGLVFVKYGGWRDIVNVFRANGYLILLIAVVTVTYRFFQVQAVALASIGLVIAIKRTSALFTTIIGGELFHEHNLSRKVWACLVMVTGAALVVI